MKKSSRRVSGEKDIAQIFSERTQVDEALARAGRDAIQRHREAGLTLPVFRNGRTVWVQPEELEEKQK